MRIAKKTERIYIPEHLHSSFLASKGVRKRTGLLSPYLSTLYQNPLSGCRPPEIIAVECEGAYVMDGFIKRLSSGHHPVVIGGPHLSLGTLRKRIEERSIIFLKFTDTHSSTYLGFRVDTAASNLSQAHTHIMGTVHVEGSLTLNAVKVRCIADIDLATFSGEGHLVIVEEAKV